MLFSVLREKFKERPTCSTSYNAWQYQGNDRKKGGQAYLDFPDVQQCIGMSGHKSRSVSLAFAHWACCDRDETVTWDTNE